MDKLAEAKLYAEKNKKSLILCKNNNLLFLRLNHNDWLALKKYAIEELKIPDIDYSIKVKPVVEQKLPTIKPPAELCDLLDEFIERERKHVGSRILSQEEVDTLLEITPKSHKNNKAEQIEPLDLEADMAQSIEEIKAKKEIKPVTDSNNNVIVSSETILEIRNRLKDSIKNLTDKKK